MIKDLVWQALPSTKCVIIFEILFVHRFIHMRGAYKCILLHCVFCVLHFNLFLCLYNDDALV